MNDINAARLRNGTKLQAMSAAGAKNKSAGNKDVEEKGFDSFDIVKYNGIE